MLYRKALNQGFETLLANVYNTRERYTAYEVPAKLLRSNSIQNVFINFVYEPLFEFDGALTGIMVMANDVTAQVEARYALQESERQFRNLITQSPVAMAVFRGRDFVIEMANPALLQKLWRKELDEVQGRKLLDVFPELKSQQLSKLTKVFDTGLVYKGNEEVIYIQSHDGQRKFYLDYEYAPLFETSNTVSGIMVTINDVTEKVEALQQINEAAERLQIVIDASELGTWELDLKTKQIIYSQRYLDIVGYHGEPYPDYKALVKFLHPDDLFIRERAFKEAYKSGVLHYVSRLIWKDGTIHWIEARGKVFFDEHNEPLKLIGTARDLTEEKLYQHRIEESEKRFSTVADTAPVLIWLSGTDKLRTFFNKAWLNFTGRTMDQEIGSGWIDAIHPEDFDHCIKTYTVNFDARKEFHMEYRLKRSDGAYRWISDNGVPRFTSNGVFEGYIGACTDIHNRILFEEQLKESESRLRIAALSSELGTWYYTPADATLSWDNATRQLYGTDVNEPVTVELFFSKVHKDDVDFIYEKIQRALNPDIAETYDVEYRIIGLPNGQVRWIHAKGKAFFDEANNPYLFSGTVLDITEKRLALAELQESEQKFRLLADSMPQFVWTGTDDGVLNYFNQSVYRYTGLTPEQVERGGWLQIIHPDDRKENIRLWRSAITSGEPFIFEHRFLRHDGEYRWQLSRATPQRDAEGNIQMWVGVSADIHDRKIFTDELGSIVDQRTRELRQLNEKLMKSNNELAQFAYVASHDLQEPLRKIQTFASRITDSEINLSDKGKDYFVRIQLASQRMQQLILDLLAFSRTNTAEKYFSRTNLNTIMQNVLEQLKERIDQKHAEINYPFLATLKVIAFQFEQLFLNLISNALKFSRNDVPLIVTINYTLINGSDVHNQKIAPDKRYHCITIADNGIGFEREFNERIFEVFQRLHSRDRYEGTGIGLAICKKIVENHKGIITAQGESDSGATFTIYLPEELSS